MDGAQIIKNAIIKNKLQRVFVYPGGTIAPIIDALNNEGIGVFCARHEQGAAYAALAVARITGCPQVVLVTSGPGVTNVLTSIADAYFDSIPLILITGQVATADLSGPSLPVRQRGFQEVNTVSIMKSVTKAQFLVKDVLHLEKALEEAFFISQEGRPGPVVIDIPMDVQRGNINNSLTNINRQDKINNKKNLKWIDAESIEQVKNKICSATRPVIIAGQGLLTAKAHEEFREFVDKTNIPVSHSLLGLGAYPTQSPIAIGFHGHTGNRYANKTIYEADLVLVLGSRLDIRQTGSCYDQFSPQAYVIRVDIDEGEIGSSRIKTDFSLCTDVKIFLSQLNKSLNDITIPEWAEWWDCINKWRTDYPLTYRDDDKVKPQSIIEITNDLTENSPVVCISGVGSHQQWVARHFDFDYPERIWLTSGGHGAMGFDLPAAIGAQLACPDKMVICFVGDGSLQMNIQELATIAEYNLPIKIIVLDNKRLAMVSQFQMLNWGEDPTCGNKTNPPFADLASVYGLRGYLVDNNQESLAILKEALFFNGPCLVHCIVDENEDVIPMLLGGQPMSKMWPYE
ncbi:MAG: thiamine pyrophosphate-binding protein [Syntrophomonadaceae bacterium]|nr:thiamine pyrophosphate-binding protein [Syntrophomonadaceae bacterium]